MSIDPGRKARELLGVLLLGSCILLTLALVSHQGLDPSASVSSPATQYGNYIGRVGALASDLLFHMLGLAAFVLPIPLLLIGYRQIRSRSVGRPLVKLFGFCVSIASLSAGLSLSSLQLPDSINFIPGGICGIRIAELLVGFLNETGAVVVVLTTLVFSLLLITRFSLDATLEWISGCNWNLFSALTRAYALWSKRHQDRRKLAQLNKGPATLASPPLPGKPALGMVEEQLENAPPENSTPTVQMQAMTHAMALTDRPQEQPFAATKLDSQMLRRYQYPRLDFLKAPFEVSSIDEEELIGRAQVLATKCAEFGVHGRVLQIHPGPVVTTFEFKPDPGVKYSRITNLDDDLCLALKAESVRIERIPGKNTVGIEVPNLHYQTICLREILEGTAFQQSESQLALALGRLINGNTYVTDLKQMPHLLIAGATGSGKSVALNSMVCSILYKASPQDVRFIMIDPKRLELGVYADIPHLLTPIVTDPKQAAHALNWAVSEMENRYRLLAEWGVRNIDQYNKAVQETSGDDQQKEGPLPYVVLIIDELADLIMTAGKEVEAALTRLAQMARAIGIHLILATQRPSVDVLTGLIKANFPCRISFRVSSKIDSRTILDGNGAEQLLGNGDMLFLPPGTSRLIRIHGAFISSKEIRKVTDFLKQQATPKYQKEVLAGGEERQGLTDLGNLQDDLYEEAARFVVETGRASTSLLQRRLRIGYGRAARLLDMMEHEGLISPPDGSKPRQVLVSSDYFNQVEEP